MGQQNGSILSREIKEAVVAKTFGEKNAVKIFD